MKSSDQITSFALGAIPMEKVRRSEPQTIDLEVSDQQSTLLPDQFATCQFLMPTNHLPQDIQEDVRSVSVLARDPPDIIDADLMPIAPPTVKRRIVTAQ